MLAGGLDPRVNRDLDPRVGCLHDGDGTAVVADDSLHQHLPGGRASAPDRYLSRQAAGQLGLDVRTR